VEFGFFELEHIEEDDGTVGLTVTYISEVIAKLSGNLTKLQKIEISYFQERYDAYLKLEPSSRAKLIEGYLFKEPVQSQRKKRKL
jgi:hypothetical protein